MARQNAQVSEHRRLTELDWLLIASWLPTIGVIAVAYFSIPIEETHVVGNDASLDRLMIAIGLVWLFVTGALVAVRRAPGGLRAQLRRERQQWREMRAHQHGDTDRDRQSQLGRSDEERP